MSDHFVQMDRYGIAVRADGAVRTSRKGVHFGGTTGAGYQLVWTLHGLKLVHRLILEAFVGPSRREVNHKNGIRSDNRLGNLEYCEHDFNSRDGVLRNGARGCYQIASGRWRARIHVGGKHIHLGYFDTEGDAHKAYLEGQKKLWRTE